MKFSRQLVLLTAASLATSGVVVATATSAFADPNGCKVGTPGFSSPNGLLTGSASGSCSASLTRSLRVEIKQDLSFRPDPLTAANEDNGTKKSYSVRVMSCDGHNNSTYYSRAFFTSVSDYHDSAHHDVQTC